MNSESALTFLQVKRRKGKKVKLVQKHYQTTTARELFTQPMKGDGAHQRQGRKREVNLARYRSRCPGGSIRPPARLRCWSAESCDPTSSPPLLWRPRRSSGPAGAPWPCSTSPDLLGPVGGWTKPADPHLWNQDGETKPAHYLHNLICDPNSAATQSVIWLLQREEDFCWTAR